MHVMLGNKASYKKSFDYFDVKDRGLNRLKKFLNSIDVLVG